jgi:uncharacterized protein with ParB-like and HNH nuclease domain
MESNLNSLSKIFTERLFRIPDYQRGYAWSEKQLKDFWNDIIQLEENKNHYTGVITLEPVPEDIFKTWQDDIWIITHKSYFPYYIVDGQQRLTTTIILIQSILERISKECCELNYTSLEEIRKKFIFDTKDKGISRSYIFGYEKDNPSYEYLKTEIFNEISSTSSKKQETIYTQNLENAKIYFLDQLSKIDKNEIEDLYKKLTQHMLFNIYTITSDIDTFVSFETMNNRGKPLSHLELLKNRLIYLSTKLSDDEFEKNSLRKKINDCWKSIYHNLGRNKLKPLQDDRFLVNHYMIYFGFELWTKEEFESRRFRLPNFYATQRDDYASFLLEKKFTTKNIHESKLTINNINDYVVSLQESVEIWYYIHNPQESRYTKDIQKYLEKLNRLGISDVAPLIMTFFKTELDDRKRLELITKLERLLFTFSLFRIRFYNVASEDFQFLSFAVSLHNKDISTKEIIKRIEDGSTKLLARKEAKEFMVKNFKDEGFYNWHGIRYFLYEYDLFLSENTKTSRVKLEWEIFSNSDYNTVEHIYPQGSRQKCWTDLFKQFNTKQKKSLRNSLGNLLPLSQPKNSSLQDKCFENKISTNKSKVGYKYGCYSENEVTEYDKWTYEEIIERGIHLVNFMEERWKIKIGNEQEKMKFLGLDFIKK